MNLTLNTLYKHFIQHPEANWIMKPANGRALYDFISQTPNIKRVLDLGTGIGLSPAIAALALLNKGEKDFHVDTIEQYDKCITIANEVIPEELKKYITIHKSETEVWETDYMPYQSLSNFKKIPGWDYDLIINDGPGPWRSEDGLKYIELPNGTIHRALIEDKLKPNTYIAYDGRVSSLGLLERYFSGNFYLIKPASQGNNLNIIQRKDNPFKFQDERLVFATQNNYFNEYKPKIERSE